MLLAIDVGNSNIKCALFAQNSEPIQRFKTPSKQPHSAQGLYEWLSTQADISQITSAIFSTVVPSLKRPVADMLKQLNIPYLQLSHSLNIPITVDGQPPKNLGTDLLSNAIAAHHLYPNHKVIISFGTALTFLALSQKGEIMGCSFLTGLGTSFRALVDDAALLNDIEIEEPESVNGLTTQAALQSGFIFGYQGAVKEIATRMAHSFDGKVTFITNGYEANLVKPPLEGKIFDAHLTLRGLYFAACDNGLHS
ncbi:MAG: type III pantothenate kinase [Alphaproteobacteria bacterium]